MMKKILDFVLNAAPLLAPVPTGWAVYAGLTQTDTWPMPPWVAVPGALALIAVTVSVSAYIVDVSTFNKTLKSAEKTLSVAAWQGWLLLAGAVASEITLALLIAVIPGLRVYAVVAFPLLSLAGMFAFVLRVGLQEQVAMRDELRTEAKEKRAEAKERQERAQSQPVARKAGRQMAACPHCHAQFSQSGLNAHVAYCKANPERRSKFSVAIPVQALEKTKDE